MTNAEIIALVYGVGGTIFLSGFFVAVVTTGARVLWYMRHARPRPRLLNRDIIVKGGMFIGFGLIAALRFLPPEARIAFTANNVAWAVITTLGPVIAIVTYDWFEIRVIPRVKD